MKKFYWDPAKELRNKLKHGVDFKTAKHAFKDPCRVIFFDPEHSGTEERFFCLGKIHGRVLTVRFTYRGQAIRIIGASCWRKGKRIYEEEKKKRKV